MLLGPIAFDLIIYLEGMERRVEADYAELAVLGGKLDAYTWQIVLHDGFCSPAAEITKLEAAVRAHAALPLIFTNGDYMGWFVPVELTETYRATMPTALPCGWKSRYSLRNMCCRLCWLSRRRNPRLQKSLQPAAKRKSPPLPKNARRPNGPAQRRFAALVQSHERLLLYRTLVLEGQRWDTLAWLYYGDSGQYGRIMQANPAVDITTHLSAGTLVLVPVLPLSEVQQVQATNDLPPWKRT